MWEEVLETYLSEVLLLRGKVVEASSKLGVPSELRERLTVGGELSGGGWC